MCLKGELQQELSSLMAKNDQVQTYINDLERTWRNVEVDMCVCVCVCARVCVCLSCPLTVCLVALQDNSKSHKQSVSDQFDAILSTLKERRKVSFSLRFIKQGPSYRSSGDGH